MRLKAAVCFGQSSSINICVILSVSRYDFCSLSAFPDTDECLKKNCMLHKLVFPLFCTMTKNFIWVKEEPRHNGEYNLHLKSDSASVRFSVANRIAKFIRALQE